MSKESSTEEGKSEENCGLYEGCWNPIRICYSLLLSKLVHELTDWTFLLTAFLECETTYHHNYSVKGGERVYYPGIPNFLQVGEHQYVETTLANGWRAKMLLGW
jgi:hypothetical protein